MTLKHSASSLPFSGTPKPLRKMLTIAKKIKLLNQLREGMSYGVTAWAF